MKLIIFDLDQTLVDFILIHDKTTNILFKEFFGINTRLTEIDFSGRSLSDNFHELARLKNVPEEVFQKNSNRLLQSYETTFGKSLPRDAKKYILPGAQELLIQLSETEHIVVLYTGDSQKIVNQVLCVTDLGKYFKFCMYGTEVKSRADMVTLAIEKAEKLTGQKFINRNIIVIGDSIRDIECGKQFNALVIAVATGFHSKKTLLQAGADYVFQDLSDYKKVLETIEGN
jgi:phosphoglycolate phosphatase